MTGSMFSRPKTENKSSSGSGCDTVTTHLEHGGPSTMEILRQPSSISSDPAPFQKNGNTSGNLRFLERSFYKDDNDSFQNMFYPPSSNRSEEESEGGIFLGIDSSEKCFDFSVPNECNNYLETRPNANLNGQFQNRQCEDMTTDVFMRNDNLNYDYQDFINSCRNFQDNRVEVFYENSNDNAYDNGGDDFFSNDPSETNRRLPDYFNFNNNSNDERLTFLNASDEMIPHFDEPSLADEEISHYSGNKIDYRDHVFREPLPPKCIKNRQTISSKNVNNPVRLISHKRDIFIESPSNIGIFLFPII